MTSNESVVRAIGSAEFDAALAEERRPVIVDFTAVWCEPCRHLAPKLERFARDEQDRVRVVSIDVDEHPEIAERYGIDGYPTLLVFQHGIPVLEWVGPDSLDPLPAVLDRLAVDPTTTAPAKPRAAVGRTVRIPGPLPLARVAIDWDPDAATGDAVVDLPAGARLSLMIARGNAGVLAGFAPDAFDSLTLFDTPVTAADAAVLGRLTGLTAVTLFDTGIDADGIGQLARLTGLQQVSVESTKSDENASPDAAAVESLRIALPHARVNGLRGRPDLAELVRAAEQATVDAPEFDGQVEVSETIAIVLRARRRTPDRVTAYLTVAISDGYHLYAPDAEAQYPLAISTDPESGWTITEIVAPVTDDGQLTGTTLLAIELIGGGDELTLHVRAQACRPDSCLAPTELRVHTALA
ncbi:thioredoxin family protein [Nocardia sp. NPDC020380]|uniref:thioredoxin family protein n=1 Tax=Nocardia sp. NPDC020380 TaxID=3364309 RepID=UPI0037B82E46